MQGHMGNLQGDQEAEDKCKGRAKAMAYISFSEKGKQDRMNSLELAGLNNFSSLWVIRISLLA